MTEYPETPRSVPAPPVVGMVGAGQLARMTSQAAIGLGVGFRVLADAADESAAQVVRGYRSGTTARWLTCAPSRPAATWSRSTTSTCPASTSPRWSATAWRSGRAPPRCASPRTSCMRERLTELGVACPRYAPVRTLAEVEAFAERPLAGGAQGRQRRLRRQGRVGLRVDAGRGAAASALAHGVRLARPRSASTSSRELAVVAARSPHRQGGGVPGRARRSSGTASAAR